MSTRWIVAIAVVVLGALWWARRAKAAMEGTANTTGAPAGALPKGVVATLKAPAKLTVLKGGKVAVATKLPPVGHGKVAPSNLFQKPSGAKPPKGSVSLPPPKLKTKPAGVK